MLRFQFIAVAVIGLFLFCGCLDTNQKKLEPPAQETPILENNAGAEQKTETATSSSEQQSEETHRTFQVGDGKKGHYEEFGRISIFQRTIGTMYRTQERMDGNLIKHAMDLYKAEHDSFPKTHEEFMTQIIEYNHIKLPELKEGCRYEYNPQSGELEIYGPKALLQ
ncbi:MAG: hypothetical protein LBJ67_10605 [Planctomycetaceae bacterium]|jgi:hypothetical protein|nr:hypothetical protein [Planctomycetaceae bacterium]